MANQTTSKPKKRIRKHLQIYQPMRCIVVEKLEVEDGVSVIRKGSHLNCGVCGGSVGIMNGEIDFPFSIFQLKSRLTHSQLYIKNHIRCNRKDCRALIFPDVKKVEFVSFENFKKLQLEAREKTQKSYSKTLSKMASEQKKELQKTKTLKRWRKVQKIIRWFRNLFTWRNKG